MWSVTYVTFKQADVDGISGVQCNKKTLCTYFSLLSTMY